MLRSSAFSPFLLLFLGLSSLLFVIPGALAQGVEEVELIEPIEPAEPPVGAPEGAEAAPVDRSGLERVFAEAEALFSGVDRPAALPLYGRLVDLLEAERALDPVGRELLIRSLLRRAQIYAALGEDALAEDALARRFAVDPGASIDATTLGVGDVVPEDFARVAERVRERSVGEITLRILPADAGISIDGEPLDEAARRDFEATAEVTVPVVPGVHDVAITRPGYTPITRELEVTAGRRLSIEEELVRVSPVLRLLTRPVGAEVLLDGEIVGVTEGAASEGTLPPGALAHYDRDDFSGELVIDGLEPGLRRLEVRREGHRPYRMELSIEEPIDYRMPPIVLEAERGQLVFADFPAGARIRVDGEAREPDVPGASRPRLTLPPGSYHVTVDSGTGMFSTRLELADRQTMEVRVELRPGLAFLGVLGNDEESARGLAQALRARLGESETWTVVDRAPEAGSVLARLGLDAETLRSPERRRAVDWSAVQAELDRRLPGLVYLFAVLDNDVLATRAEVLVASAAPGPARPDALEIPLRDPESLVNLRRLFERDLERSRPWLGALVIDSDAEPHPVVAPGTPPSPAEAAGLAVGDRILGWDGVAITRRAGLEQRLLASEPGTTVDVAIQRAGGGRTLRVTPGRSPVSLTEDPALPRALAWAALERNGRGESDDRWLDELDRGILLLGAGDPQGAVQRLRQARAPQTSHGLSKAAVDYYLGVALARLGPDLHGAAREALERAAGLPGARLQHHDGPFLQPRARARLAPLTSGVDGGPGS